MWDGQCQIFSGWAVLSILRKPREKIPFSRVLHPCPKWATIQKKLCSTLTAEADFRAVLKAMSRATTVMKLLHKSATIAIPMLTIHVVLCSVLTEQATMCRGMRSASICICRVFSMLRKTMKSAQTAKTLLQSAKLRTIFLLSTRSLCRFLNRPTVLWHAENTLPKSVMSSRFRQLTRRLKSIKNPPCMTARSICLLTATMLFLRGNTSKSFPKEVLTVQGTLW